MLIVYRDLPFSAGNEVDQDDVFTGDGASTSFVLSRKAVGRLAGTVQFDNTQYYQYNGGFVRTADGFQLESAAPLNSQGVAPGLSSVLFDQLFDASSVPGVAVPNIQEVPFYLADSDSIPLYSYHKIPSFNGVRLSMSNLVSAAAASLSWIQLACAATDTDGLALAYGATGAPLYTDDLQSYGSLSASSSSGASSIFVDLASTFVVGDYIMINAGGMTQEITKIIGYTAPHTFSVVGSQYDHFIGETVYACGRKFWMKCTVPFGAAQGQATNFYNLSLQTYFSRRSRL